MTPDLNHRDVAGCAYLAHPADTLSDEDVLAEVASLASRLRFAVTPTTRAVLRARLRGTFAAYLWRTSPLRDAVRDLGERLRQLGKRAREALGAGLRRSPAPPTAMD